MTLLRTHQAIAELVVIIFPHGVRPSVDVKQKHGTTLRSRPGKQYTLYDGHYT